MSEEMAVTEYNYPCESVGRYCEDRVRRVVQVQSALVRVNVEAVLEMGRCLNEVKRKLPHGTYESWLEWRLPGWKKTTTHKWRVFAERVDKVPETKCSEFWKILEQFLSIEAALEFPALPEHVQKKVVQNEAWTHGQFKALLWDCAMRETLEDNDLGYNHRHGTVLHAIEEARGNPTLEKVALALYEENRETFARLSDRTPAEVDVEVGIEWKEPKDDGRVSAQFVESDDGSYWLCRNDNGVMKALAPIRSRIVLWQDQEPVMLAAFPETNDGPTAASWQRAGAEAMRKRLNATSLETLYGEVL